MYLCLRCPESAGTKDGCGLGRRYSVSGPSWDAKVGSALFSPLWKACDWAVLELRNVQLSKAFQIESMEVVLIWSCKIRNCSLLQGCNRVIQNWWKALAGISSHEPDKRRSNNEKESLQCYLDWVSGCQCQGHSAPARWSSRADDISQHGCFARSQKDCEGLWVFGHDVGIIWWSLQRLEWCRKKTPNNPRHVNEVPKVRNHFYLFFGSFGSVCFCMQYCSRACRYSILQHKCCHALLFVFWQLKVLVMKMKSTRCSIIKNNSSCTQASIQNRNLMLAWKSCMFF